MRLRCLWCGKYVLEVDGEYYEITIELGTQEGNFICQFCMPEVRRVYIKGRREDDA